MKLGIVYTNWRSFYSFSIGKEPIFGPASGLRNSDIVIIGQLRKYGISYFLKQEVHERELLVCILPQYTSLDSILPKQNTRVVQGGSEVEKKKKKKKKYMYRAVKQNPHSKTGFLVVSINFKKKLSSNRTVVMFQVSSHSQKLGSFGPCHCECEKASKVQYIYVYILYMHTRLCFTLKTRGHSE